MVPSPQTAMRVRIAPPKILDPRDFKVQTYELQFQSKQKDGTWQLVMSDVAAAAEAEGAGYFGWGAHKPGTPPQTTATIGTYRVRAVVKQPELTTNLALSVGEWVEFAIAGTPGHDVLVGPVTGDSANRADVYSKALGQPSTAGGGKTRVTPATQKAMAPAPGNEPASTLRR